MGEANRGFAGGLTTEPLESCRLEHVALCRELRRRGFALESVASTKHLQARSSFVQGAQLVFGDLEFVQAALRVAGRRVPKPDDYPEACRQWLRRRVWRGNLKQVPPCFVFVKPAEKAKKFTGVVLRGSYDAFLVNGAGRNTAVWFSEVVDWRQEWRVFVCCGRVLATSLVPPGPDMEDAPEDAAAATVSEHLDMEVVRACVQAFCESGAAPAGFVADFGVLADGRTALVEVNDGFAFGLYSREDEVVRAAADVMLARWGQLALPAGMQVQRLCEVCEGTGLLLRGECPMCDGVGLLASEGEGDSDDASLPK